MIAKRAEPSEGSAVRLRSANTLRSGPGTQLKSISAERSLLSMRGDSPRPRWRDTEATASAASLRPGSGFPLFNAPIDDDAVLGVLDIVTRGLQRL